MRKFHFFLLFAICISCEKPTFKKEWTNETAPATFTAKFETTKGDFEIEVKRKYSPKAADRFYQLVKHSYFDNAIFYRVVPDFVAQFGNTEALEMDAWRSVKIPDEEVQKSNERGSVSFARSGKETRDLELFINLKDNSVLDTLNFEGVKGFAPIGNVSKGMDVVDKLFSGYGENTMSDPNMYTNRQAFRKTFPKLDLIEKAYLVD